MPILAPVPPPKPPDWWALLTVTMRKTISTRLRVKGIDTSTWPK